MESEVGGKRGTYLSGRMAGRPPDHDSILYTDSFCMDVDFQDDSTFKTTLIDSDEMMAKKPPLKAYSKKRTAVEVKKTIVTKSPKTSSLFKPQATSLRKSKDSSAGLQSSTPQQVRNNNDIKYMRSDGRPYKVVVELKIINNGEPVKPPMDIEVSRTLVNMGVNFSLLERIGRRKWYVTFSSGEAANNAITNKYVLESKFRIYIQWFMVYRKVVISGAFLVVTPTRTFGKNWERVIRG